MLFFFFFEHFICKFSRFLKISTNRKKARKLIWNVPIENVAVVYLIIKRHTHTHNCACGGALWRLRREVQKINRLRRITATATCDANSDCDCSAKAWMRQPHRRRRRPVPGTAAAALETESKLNELPKWKHIWSWTHLHDVFQRTHNESKRVWVCQRAERERERSQL